MTPAEVAGRDPGRQPERTALSWNRTALAAAVNAFLLLRSGVGGGGSAFLVLSGALFVASGAAVAYGAHRRHQLTGDVVIVSPGPAVMLLATSFVVVASAAGVASILVEL